MRGVGDDSLGTEIVDPVEVGSGCEVGSSGVNVQSREKEVDRVWRARSDRLGEGAADPRGCGSGREGGVVTGRVSCEFWKVDKWLGVLVVMTGRVNHDNCQSDAVVIGTRGESLSSWAVVGVMRSWNDMGGRISRRGSVVVWVT